MKTNNLKLPQSKLNSFYKSNPDFDILKFNFHSKEHTDELGKHLHKAGVKDVAPTVKLMKSYQRLLAVHPDAKLAASLVSKGILSANHLARIPVDKFKTAHTRPLGIDDNTAEEVHRRATGVRNKSMHLWASVSGTVGSKLYSNSPIDNVSLQVKKTFQDLPSYQDLFGTLDYCSCDECRSIFGAAAYLVDLLRIIDEYVTTPNIATIDPDLLFNTRRPDIGEIELTCAKTNDLVPYLQIVNERLLYSAQQTLKAPTPEKVVELMATTLNYPQALPFNEPLNQVQVLLGKLGTSYGDILSAWKIADKIVAASRLNLSTEEQKIVTTELTTAAQLMPFYNVADINELKDANVFMDKTWMSFADMLTLLNQDLSDEEEAAGLQVNFFINQKLAGKWVYLSQEDGKEPVLNNLDIAPLDQINRVQRLSANAGYSVQQVDWALRCVQKGGTPVISDDALVILEPLIRTGSMLGMDLQTATVLLGPIKTYGIGEDKAGSMFDKLFNTPAILSRMTKYHPSGNSLNPAYKDTPLPWKPGSQLADDINSINRVLPGLNISISDANTLGVALFGTAAQTLTVDTLSALYRHILISKALQLPIDQYVIFLKLVGVTSAPAPTITELVKLVSVGQWLGQANVSVYQLNYIINGAESIYVNPFYRADTVTEWQRGLWATIPVTSPTAGKDITAQVAVLFGVDTQLIEPVMIMALAAVALPTGATTWEEAFLTADTDGKTPKYPDYVNDVLKLVSRWLVLADALNIPALNVASIAACPVAYGLTVKFDEIPLQAVQNIWQVQQMMQYYGDQQNYLLRYIALATAQAPRTDQLEVLYKVTGWQPEQVGQLLDGPLKGVTAICDQLTDLQRCFAIMDMLGANPVFMTSITELGGLDALTNWAKFNKIASDVLAKSASRYGSQWNTIWTTLSGDIAVNMRDALLSLVMAQLNDVYSGINAPRNVYEYLLTDVEMGPQTSISYIKEALNAAQTYLQRCRLRLEPGVLDMTHIQEPWWEWMMNYRVWEANRQIFVYPENYLVPSLRKNTSQQFAALVQDLQQSDINKAYVNSAFTSYINGFAGVTDVKIVDSYRTKINDADTLYLLARSKTAPYTFYNCRQVEFMPWTAWEKIELTINSPNCTLVYAFNRPFIFWTELKKNNTSTVSGTGGAVQTDNSVAYTASVMYSFLNQEEKWVQPQTLIDQQTVFFESADSRKVALADEDIFEGLFLMNAPAWNKVFAFNVTADNYVNTPKFKAEAERLVIMYGPNLLNTGETVIAGDNSPSGDPGVTEFWTNLHNRAEDHNRMADSMLSGNLSLQPVAILNMSLENDVLVHLREMVITDSYQAGSMLSYIQAEMQSSGDVMQITHNGQPITANRNVVNTLSVSTQSAPLAMDGDAFISAGISSTLSRAIYTELKTATVINANGMVDASAMATLNLYTTLKAVIEFNKFGPTNFLFIMQVLLEHMDATELFKSVGGAQNNVMPVGGQPGWFVFSVGDEVFLLSPKPVTGNDPLFSTFSDALAVGPPLIQPSFCVMAYAGPPAGAINANASAQVLAALEKFSLVLNGRLTANATLGNVQFALNSVVAQGVITQAQIPYIYNALTNTPMVFSNDFIGSKIDTDVSGKIYAALKNFSILDVNGRIYESNLTGPNVAVAVTALLQLGTITQSQIAVIYKRLAQTPPAVAINYINKAAGVTYKGTGEFHFDVTRLSTGAINKISRALFVNGVELLLDLKTQQIPVTPVLPFDRFTPSRTNLNWPAALDATQVDFDGLYGQYYWEIFYFIPTLITASLNGNQRFQEAQTWLQHVFNPTVPESFVTADLIVQESSQSISIQQATLIITQLQTNKIGSPAEPILSLKGEVNPNFLPSTDLAFLKVADPSLTDEQVQMVRNILLNYQLSAPASHYWQFRPFRNYTLQSLEDMLSDSNPAVKVYNDDPFDPFAIARLRIGAFEKSVLMQYIDNLIAWGDQLFTQDTWEAITAAYMLYVYAYNLLGPRPEEVGEAPGGNIVLTFDQIKAKYPDGIPQFLIDLEYFIPNGSGSATPMTGHAFNDLYVYFCVPENKNLMARWDTVEDRMFKINNSLNIKGVFRQLALFEPPLDPLQLVKAAAAGNNVQLAATSKPALSPYRFSAAMASAQALCSTLIELGNSLLSALEKNDAEGMAVLRNTQEGQILNMITQIKQDSITELQATLSSLNATLNSANNRVTFYTTMVDKGLSGYEESSLSATEAALAFNLLGSISKTAATVGYAVPQVGSPFAMTYGGVQIGNALNAASGVFEIGAEISNFIAQRSATMGGYERRAQDWTLQQQTAQFDVDSITQQILAADTQLQSARQDLAVHKKSIDQNKAIEAFMQGKFTNQQLYQWMAGRLGAVYFQTYSLALDVARQAEAAYQFETDSSQTFLSFDYWDGLHKGLTSGESLRLALNRMDTAYRTNDYRSLEIEKNISLAMIAPDQLLALKTKGACVISLPESLFDYDYPGQYARKIATISLSIPAVLGPYQNIKAILTQTKNSVVTEPHIEPVDFLLGITQTQPESGLRQNWAVSQSIALSRGVDDSGMFVVDFQDLRYLPFENTGAVSEWTLSMPLETNRFNFEQLTDVIINLRYTALFDGGLETKVKASLSKAPLNGGLYIDSAMQSNAWFSFMSDHSDSKKQTLTLTVNAAQIGYFKSLNYTAVTLQLNVAAGVKLGTGANFMTLYAGTQPKQTPGFTDNIASVTGITWNGKTMGNTWKFEFALDDVNIAPLLGTDKFIDPAKLLDMQVVALYQAKVF